MVLGERTRKLKAVERIAAGDTPVSDWQEMEAELERTCFADGAAEHVAPIAPKES